MTATERLFWTEPGLDRFTARVVEVRPHEAGFAVVLDRTGFFPESGGQPSDRGRIGDAQVVSVLEEGESIVHLVEGPAPPPGSEAACIVDMARRRDIGGAAVGQAMRQAGLTTL